MGPRQARRHAAGREMAGHGMRRGQQCPASTKDRAASPQHRCSRIVHLSKMRRSGRKTPGRAATSLVSNESYRRAPTNAAPAAFIAGAARPPLAILCLMAQSLKLLDTVHRFTGPPRRPPASTNRTRGPLRAPAPCTWRMPPPQRGGRLAPRAAHRPRPLLPLSFDGRYTSRKRNGREKKGRGDLSEAHTVNIFVSSGETAVALLIC